MTTTVKAIKGFRKMKMSGIEKIKSQIKKEIEAWENKSVAMFIVTGLCKQPESTEYKKVLETITKLESALKILE